MNNVEWKRRFTIELRQILRMQIFIVPIAVGAAYYFAAPISDEEKKRMQDNYQRKAGWSS